MSVRVHLTLTYPTPDRGLTLTYTSTTPDSGLNTQTAGTVQTAITH